MAKEYSFQSQSVHRLQSDLLAIQDNLLKASAEELLRTDLLHITTKEQNIHKEYLPDSYVIVYYRTGLPPTRLHTNWKGPMRVSYQRIKLPLYTPRPHNWQREGLPCVRHEAFYL